MSSRYIPPHLRSGQHPASSSSSSSQLTSCKERNPADGYTPSEIANRFNLSTKAGTLNASDDAPDRLAFVLVFKDQHPEWESDGKLLCKTNLHLLSSPAATTTPAASEAGKEVKEEGGEGAASDVMDVKEGKEPAASPPSSPGSHGKENDKPPLPTHPIPLFTQLPFSSSASYQSRAPTTTTSYPLGTSKPNPNPEQDPRFLFSGHYTLRTLSFLDPRSPALISMLDRKFTPQGKKRSPENWDRSLGMRWAVAGFEKVGGEEEGEGGRLGDPMVPVLKAMEPREEGKGVREMLEGMRLGGDAGGKENR